MIENDAVYRVVPRGCSGRLQSRGYVGIGAGLYLHVHCVRCEIVGAYLECYRVVGQPAGQFGLHLLDEAVGGLGIFSADKPQHVRNRDRVVDKNGLVAHSVKNISLAIELDRLSWVVAVVAMLRYTMRPNAIVIEHCCAEIGPRTVSNCTLESVSVCCGKPRTRCAGIPVRRGSRSR